MENAPTQPVKLSSTQLGAIGEKIIAAQLMLVSDGRLLPFRPVADDDGTDLLIADKLTGRIFSIQVKARFISQTEPPRTVQFDTRIATFREDTERFVLAAAIDPDNGAIWMGWLVPAAELRAIAKEKAGYLIIRPSPKASSNDRYSRWRCGGAKALACSLLQWTGSTER